MSLELIRKNPAMYLPSGNLADIAECVKKSANFLGSSVKITQGRSWWVIEGPDWIKDEKQFKEIVPFPELGQNAMHPEVLITAFAKSVLTGVDDNSWRWIAFRP